MSDRIAELEAQLHALETRHEKFIKATVAIVGHWIDRAERAEAEVVSLLGEKEAVESGRAPEPQGSPHTAGEASGAISQPPKASARPEASVGSTEASS